MFTQLRCYVTRRYTEELHALRQAYFPGPLAHTSDGFDACSDFVVFETGGKAIAVGRLTPSVGGPLITESGGKGAFRTGTDTVDIGKYIIVRQYQGIRGMYRLLCLAAMAYALQCGYAYANAAVAAGSRLTLRLQELGFAVCGADVAMLLSSGVPVVVTPLVCHLALHEGRIREGLLATEEGLAAEGLEVVREW